MTILTKPSTGAKLNPKAADPATVENGPIIEQYENDNADKLLLLRERARRFTGSSLLLILATLCLVCMGILIGLVVYRRVQLQRMHFRGMCNLPYEDRFDDNKDLLAMRNQLFSTFDKLTAEERTQLMDLNDDRDYFREEFDLDLSEDNSMAQINVPDFRDGRIGRFLHDFKYNQTAIIDESKKRCFIMPLDREVILPPKSLADVIQKMYSGYYDINTTSVRKNMRVVTPAISDLSSISQNIQYACNDMDIYRLEKFVGSVYKRSADLTEDGKYAEYAGTLVQYNIMNIDTLNRQ